MTDTRHRTTLGSRFRFGVRLLGLLGVVAAAVGGVIAWQECPQVFTAGFWANPVASATPLLDGSAGVVPQVGAWLLFGGAALVALCLLVELAGGLFLVAGAKSAQGGFTLFLALLGAAAVVVVNLVSVKFYARIDCTRDARFTLDRPLIDELKKLDPNTPTTVVVLQLDKTSAFDPDLPDAVTSAAQTKITEKVLDLIDDLRQHPELSARFDVHVLSRKDEAFERQLDAVAKGQPGLKTAVEGAAESSVFFAANGRVRRMPFAQFYLLDKTASRGKAEVGSEPTTAANLVLAPQGKERFVRALVGLERKKPKVGLLTIHPLLTSRPLEDDEGAAYTSAGLRAALERDGCEVVDVVLRKVEGNLVKGPAADSLAESRLDEVEGKYLAASESALEAEVGVRQLDDLREKVKTAPIEQIEFNLRIPRGTMAEAEYRAHVVKKRIDPRVKQFQADAEEAHKRMEKNEPEYRRLLDDDKVQADRRAADIKAKLTAVAADCDLLILPRLTTISLVNGSVVNARIHSLAKAQAEVVKDFLAAGKPVLFAFGPTASARGFAAADDTERVLERLGIELGMQTVITTAEAEAMKNATSLGGRSVDLPPLEVALWPADTLGALAGGGVFAGPDELEALRRTCPVNPVAAAFDRANRTVDGTLELKRSGYRPLFLAPRDKPFPFPAELLYTTADAWNESRPLAEPPQPPPPGSPPPATPPRGYLPKFDTTDADDPKSGTREEERKQKFLVGAAVEVPVPAEWTDPKAGAVQAAAVIGATSDIGFGPGVASAVLAPERFHPPVKDAKTVRVAVFGHGGLFVGKKLAPGQEALLTSTVNWQLARDDSLPKDVPDADKWRFPRVPLDEKERWYWSVGAWLGLPFAAALLGLVALMLRRLR